MTRRSAFQLGVIGWLAVWTTACRAPTRDPATDPRCRVEAGEGNRPYFAGNAGVRDEIASLVAELARARGEKIVEVGMRLVGKGEPAVPALRTALTSDDAALRANAAYLLGVLKDRRTIPDLERVATEDPAPAVRYEAAGALLELGDPFGFPPLVEGLSDIDARWRAKCIDVLAERTHERYGFEPDADPADRSAAIRRWRSWLDVRAKHAAPAIVDPIPLK